MVKRQTQPMCWDVTIICTLAPTREAGPAAELAIIRKQDYKAIVCRYVVGDGYLLT